MTTAFHDAFIRTKSGAELVTTIKTQQNIIAERIRQLKELAYTTFVAQVPDGHSRQYAVYHEAIPHIRALGVKGGQEYDDALTSLKYAWADLSSFREALAKVTGAVKA